MFRRWLREYYLLSRGEQRALLMLSLSLMLAVAVRLTVQLLPGKDPPGMSAFMQESREIIAALDRMDSLSSERAYKGSAGDTLDVPDDRYRSGAPVAGPAPGLWKPKPIDINRADSAQLLPLPGIGPVFSGRIIRYRELLGGFASVHQLSEVYGLRPETVVQIEASILVDTAAIRRLDMNGSSFSDLLRHPYLDFADVKALVDYRDFSGRIGSVREIRDNHLLSDSTMDRMIPYMDFDR